MKVTNKHKIVALEIAMLLGIVLSLFMVPRNTSLLTFGIISGGAFLLGNIALFVKAWQVGNKPATGMSTERNNRLNVIIALFALYWLICFLLRSC